MSATSWATWCDGRYRGWWFYRAAKAVDWSWCGALLGSLRIPGKHANGLAKGWLDEHWPSRFCLAISWKGKLAWPKIWAGVEVCAFLGPPLRSRFQHFSIPFPNIYLLVSDPFLFGPVQVNLLLDGKKLILNPHIFSPFPNHSWCILQGSLMGSNPNPPFFSWAQVPRTRSSPSGSMDIRPVAATCITSSNVTCGGARRLQRLRNGAQMQVTVKVQSNYIIDWRSQSNHWFSPCSLESFTIYLYSLEQPCWECPRPAKYMGMGRQLSALPPEWGMSILLIHIYVHAEKWWHTLWQTNIAMENHHVWWGHHHHHHTLLYYVNFLEGTCDEASKRFGIQAIWPWFFIPPHFRKNRCRWCQVIGCFWSCGWWQILRQLWWSRLVVGG